MSWLEFQSLLCNLPSDSQLMQIISIRKAEGDELQNMPSPQRKIRDDWYSWLAEQSASKNNGSVQQLESMFQSYFGRKEG